MTLATEKAYKAYQRALRAAENRAIRNAPENIVDFKRRNARIARLKATYETLLEAEKETPAEPDLCPACGRLAILSDEKERGVQFTEAVCDGCRERAIKDSQMDSYDRDYERQRARGWAD